MLILLSAGSVVASGMPEQSKAKQSKVKQSVTPDTYRLCAGEIPSVRAITACLRRHKASLSEAAALPFSNEGDSSGRGFAHSKLLLACWISGRGACGYLVDIYGKRTQIPRIQTTTMVATMASPLIVQPAA
ncbi:MAG: hypothetical protein ACREDL_24935 [Bradyrhizobium sp.]